MVTSLIPTIKSMVLQSINDTDMTFCYVRWLEETQEWETCTESTFTVYEPNDNYEDSMDHIMKYSWNEMQIELRDYRHALMMCDLEPEERAEMLLDEWSPSLLAKMSETCLRATDYGLSELIKSWTEDSGNWNAWEPLIIEIKRQLRTFN